MKMKAIRLLFIIIAIPTLFVFSLNRSTYAKIYVKLSSGGTPSATDYYSSSYVPAKAFDTYSSTYWCSKWMGSEMNPKWLRYELSTAKVVNTYIIQSYPYPYYYPIDWYFQGSNDGSTWITLDTQTGQTGWAGNEWREYAIANITAYKFYRIYITEIQPYWEYIPNIGYLGHYYAAISEFQLHYVYPDGCNCGVSGTLVNHQIYSCAGNLCVAGTVNSGVTVTLTAGGSVTLLPGFSAKAGSTCHILGGGVDSDFDGLPDTWEMAQLSTLIYEPDNDPDLDLIDLYWEYLLGLGGNNPEKDIDNDGLPDWYEVDSYENLDHSESDGDCDCD